MSRFQLVLEAHHVDGQPPAVRVRRALKALGRAYQLRCLSIVEIQKETAAEDGDLSDRDSKRLGQSQRTAG